jgi:hypothetical protein
MAFSGEVVLRGGKPDAHWHGTCRGLAALQERAQPLKEMA